MSVDSQPASQKRSFQLIFLFSFSSHFYENQEVLSLQLTQELGSWKKEERARERKGEKSEREKRT